MTMSEEWKEDARKFWLLWFGKKEQIICRLSSKASIADVIRHSKAYSTEEMLHQLLGVISPHLPCHNETIQCFISTTKYSVYSTSATACLVAILKWTFKTLWIFTTQQKKWTIYREETTHKPNQKETKSTSDTIDQHTNNSTTNFGKQRIQLTLYSCKWFLRDHLYSLRQRLHKNASSRSTVVLLT